MKKKVLALSVPAAAAALALSLTIALGGSSTNKAEAAGAACSGTRANLGNLRTLPSFASLADVTAQVSSQTDSATEAKIAADR